MDDFSIQICPEKFFNYRIKTTSDRRFNANNTLSNWLRKAFRAIAPECSLERAMGKVLPSVLSYGRQGITDRGHPVAQYTYPRIAFLVKSADSY